ncbi:ABC transporter ATP-binding protein [Pararhodobacter aggregans]|uniref:Spermidine/putrescine import ATP-binding protein PotA n=1 Tax=Pararhodobacter aggregans TaxID=404875 RepID=A0A2T7UT54_9RHOB|nr:ABC transporter ATP-binding protein [Pararhodobacter aggregans]PTX03471.1 putative spermidine/putrescine transport system ATP-binding protein [Pararhodobacter aggregans]PVE47761.1 spermidine/putrescine ABC transporter ATP-binding protein [Pararhodobacter aggregans]
MDATQAAVRFEGVQKSYDGETLVVKDLNLSIAKGEFVTMLGPSGSGKTTCLMMLAGFETATRGEIYIGQRSINRVPPHKRNIGMVFQNYALFPHMSVAENLAYPLKVRGIDKAERETRVLRALDMVQLAPFANRRPGMLSGGQQQRVAVARALVFDPDIVLMDEPLGALDKQLREQMQYEIKHIHERIGVTVVYVTHDQSEALTMSNRIAVFNDGVIQQLAPPTELYERPSNAFVAHFIGENNRLDGIVRSRDGDICQVELGDGSMVRSLAVNIGGVGSRTTLSLRPERVTVHAKAGEIDNVFAGKVEELIYLGDHIRTRVSLCGQDDFIVKLPNSDRHAMLEPGANVHFGWNAGDCRALDG